MHRNWLRQKLENYQPATPTEAASLIKVLDLLEHHPRCFERDYYTPGHITGSAWIVNRDRTKALLHKHRKFNTWIQLGGHSDSDPFTNLVALREAEEESGLKSVRLVSDDIFDIDAHDIDSPNHPPKHLHCDIRFLVEADENEAFSPIEGESKELAWIPLEEIAQYNREESITRLAEKAKKLSHEN